MSGWLPFDREIAGILKLDGENHGENDDEDPFFRDDQDEDDIPAPV